MTVCPIHRAVESKVLWIVQPADVILFSFFFSSFVPKLRLQLANLL